MTRRDAKKSDEKWRQEANTQISCQGRAALGKGGPARYTPPSNAKQYKSLQNFSSQQRQATSIKSEQKQAKGSQSKQEPARV